MSSLLRQPCSDLKETNRLCRKATFLVCIIIFLSICNYAEAQKPPIEVCFILENPTSNKYPDFDRTLAGIIEENLRDLENKPQIESHCMTPKDYATRGYTKFLECAKGNNKPYALTVNLTPHRDNKTISIDFTLFDTKNITSPLYHYTEDAVDIDQVLLDKDKIEIDLKRIIGVIRNKPYKIIFTYCFDYSGPDAELNTLKNDMPKGLQLALEDILVEKKLDKVYQVKSIPVDCDKKEDRARYQKGNYDYFIKGTLSAKIAGSLKVNLVIFGQRGQPLDIPPFELTGRGNVIGLSNVTKKLANHIIEKLPSITKGGP
jgi:hypothetical protein